MKFEEALKYLREGKKIRRVAWDGYRYIYYKDDYVHIESGKQLDAVYRIEYFLKNTDWELYEEPILGKEEKEYLSNVIKPFREKVVYIAKIECLLNYECVCIAIVDETNIWFPSFKANTMYKGMEPDKKYTLKELGL
jgi:hypothetical protein